MSNTTEELTQLRKLCEQLLERDEQREQEMAALRTRHLPKPRSASSLAAAFVANVTAELADHPGLPASKMVKLCGSSAKLTAYVEQMGDDLTRVCVRKKTTKGAWRVIYRHYLTGIHNVPEQEEQTRKHVQYYLLDSLQRRAHEGFVGSSLPEVVRWSGIFPENRDYATSFLHHAVVEGWIEATDHFHKGLVVYQITKKGHHYFIDFDFNGEKGGETP